MEIACISYHSKWTKNDNVHVFIDKMINFDSTHGDDA